MNGLHGTVSLPGAPSQRGIAGKVRWQVIRRTSEVDLMLGMNRKSLTILTARKVANMRSFWAVNRIFSQH
jgi:hypothetical protein